MKISYREHQLTECQLEGRRAFLEKYKSICPDYAGDKGKQEAWRQGYSLEAKQAVAEHRIGYTLNI